MVTFGNKQIFIDGKPVILLSGETHYFRQPKENWQHLLDEAKEMGLNCISSYVPWILHEEEEGAYCFEDNLDLGAFIDLCAANGLYFFVRPGPFIMAEMKKEGIPYWVAHKHPDMVSVGFDGVRAIGNTVDYLEPGYLQECRKWYEKIMSVIRPRLQCEGGNIIGVQLDNEIGMLNWISNQPILNDNALPRFLLWLTDQYSADELRDRYPFASSILELKAFLPATASWTALDGTYAEFASFREIADKLRSPSEEYAVAFHLDYGRFLRDYYARYTAILKGYAEECGIHDTPFFVNIHGTGDRRIFDYPLGVSQLCKAINLDNVISGTDVYLGEPQEGTYQDMYVANAITDCMNKKGNPLTSIEFESGDGDYSGLGGRRYHPSAASHKMLQCLSQNARMLSFYLFSGGVNYYLHHPEHDGNERMAFTGEMHGGNSPVQPDGSRSYSFHRIGKTARTIHALNELIANSVQETDGIVMAYIPDYFLTEMCYVKSDKMRDLIQNLKQWRCAGRIDSVARGFLSNGLAFTAADIQNESIPECRLLFCLSARFMAADIQKKLLEFVQNGGKLLLYGEVPLLDLEGNDCTILKDAMGLLEPKALKNNEPVYYLTIDTAGPFQGKIPSQRTDTAQCFPADSDAILTPFGTDLMCGFLKKVGGGTIAAITTDYPAEMHFYQMLWDTFDLHASLKAPCRRQGIYLSSTKSSDGQRLIYALNLDVMDKVCPLYLDGEILFEDFLFTEKVSMILPVNVRTAGGTIVKSTAQILEISDSCIRFDLTQRGKDVIYTKSINIAADPAYTLEKKDDMTLIRPTDPHADKLTVYLCK